jgi:alanine racemase
MAGSTNQLQIILGASHVRIDLERYERNVRILREIAGAEREFMAVIKANAYGHGAIQCASTALQAGASHLAVARVSEAIQLRRAGITAPILVFGGPNPGTIELAIRNDLTLSIGSTVSMDELLRVTERTGLRARAHLKVDSGLHRYGVLPALARAVARRLSESPFIDLEGIYGHFSSADEVDSPSTDDQTRKIEALTDLLEGDGIRFRYIHLPNSAATIRGKIGRANLVRAGIATYGLAPSGEIPLPEGVLPVMSVHSRLTRVFTIESGGGVSYGLTYRAETDEPAATVPIGYADGLPRSLSNTGWFVINGSKCPIRGRVCMDQTVVGLSEAVSEHTEAKIIGDGSDDAMTLDSVAELDGTINYEIATRLSARMPRIYYRGSEPVGWEDPILGERGST